MKTKQGFAGIAALIAVIVAIIIGGAYVIIRQDEQITTDNFNFTPPATTTSISSCVPENGQYGAPESTRDLCCPGLIKQPSSESPSGTWGTCIKPKNETIQTLTAEKILNSNGFINGEKGSPGNGQYEYISDKIIFGNLDEDPVLEAVTIHGWCGASCGQGVVAFKLVPEGGVAMLDLPNTGVSGAAQNISSVAITLDKLITAVVTDGDGTRVVKSKVGMFRGVFMVLPLTQ